MHIIKLANLLLLCCVFLYTMVSSFLVININVFLDVHADGVTKLLSTRVISKISSWKIVKNVWIQNKYIASN